MSVIEDTLITLSLSLAGLMAIFPGGFRLADTRMSPFWIFWSKDNGAGGDN